MARKMDPADLPCNLSGDEEDQLENEPSGLSGLALRAAQGDSCFMRLSFDMDPAFLEGRYNAFTTFISELPSPSPAHKTSHPKLVNSQQMNMTAGRMTKLKKSAEESHSAPALHSSSSGMVASSHRCEQDCSIYHETLPMIGIERWTCFFWSTGRTFSESSVEEPNEQLPSLRSDQITRGPLIRPANPTASFKETAVAFSVSSLTSNIIANSEMTISRTSSFQGGNNNVTSRSVLMPSDMNTGVHSTPEANCKVKLAARFRAQFRDIQLSAASKSPDESLVLSPEECVRACHSGDAQAENTPAVVKLEEQDSFDIGAGRVTCVKENVLDAEWLTDAPNSPSTLLATEKRSPNPEIDGADRLVLLLGSNTSKLEPHEGRWPEPTILTGHHDREDVADSCISAPQHWKQSSPQTVNDSPSGLRSTWLQPFRDHGKVASSMVDCDDFLTKIAENAIQESQTLREKLKIVEGKERAAFALLNDCIGFSDVLAKDLDESNRKLQFLEDAMQKLNESHQQEMTVATERIVALETSRQQKVTLAFELEKSITSLQSEHSQALTAKEHRVKELEHLVLQQCRRYGRAKEEYEDKIKDIQASSAKVVLDLTVKLHEAKATILEYEGRLASADEINAGVLF